MLPVEKRKQFVEHRSEGLSLRKIGGLLGISYETARQWEQELKDEIAKLKQVKLDELYDSYTMRKEARIKALGESLNTIEQALTEADLSTVAPEKLLDMKLKYLEALGAEYITPREPLINNNEAPAPKKLILALAEIVDKVRAGDLSDKQADKEVKAIYNLLKGYEVIELKEKVEFLELALGKN